MYLGWLYWIAKCCIWFQCWNWIVNKIVWSTRSDSLALIARLCETLKISTSLLGCELIKLPLHVKPKGLWWFGEIVIYHKSDFSPWMNAWFGIIFANIILQPIVLWMRGNGVIFDSVKSSFVIEQFDQVDSGKRWEGMCWSHNWVMMRKFNSLMSK